MTGAAEELRRWFAPTGAARRVCVGCAADLDMALSWTPGSLRSLVVVRGEGDLGAFLNAWTMHVETTGVLVLDGFGEGDPGVPPLVPWCGPDGRVWVPAGRDESAFAWLCAGYMGDR